MKKISELKVSANTQRIFEESLERAAQDILTEMKIVGFDQVRVSLDISLVMPGKPIGIKYTAFKSEQFEKIYDRESKP